MTTKNDIRDDVIYLPLESTTSKDPIARICIEREFNLENGIRIGNLLTMRSRDGGLFIAGVIAGAGIAEDSDHIHINTKDGEEFVFRVA